MASNDQVNIKHRWGGTLPIRGLLVWGLFYVGNQVEMRQSIIEQGILDHPLDERAFTLKPL
jgi:hypothetical protein